MEEIQPTPEESLKRQFVSALNVCVATEGADIMPLLLVVAELMNMFPRPLEMDKKRFIAEWMRDPGFHVPVLTGDLEKNVYRKLFAFLRSLKEFPPLLVKKSEKKYFAELSSWMNVMVDAIFDINAKDERELGSFSRGYSSPEEHLMSSGEEKSPEQPVENIARELQHETDKVIKSYYDNIYRPMDFRTLMRLHNGIEIFRLLEELTRLAEDEPTALKAELYKGLMMALHRCGVLTLPLLQELRLDASQKTFDATGKVNEILNELLKKDTTAILEDYFPQQGRAVTSKGEKSQHEPMGEMDDDIESDTARVRQPLVESKLAQFDPKEPFLRVLARKYNVQNSREHNAIWKLNSECQELEPFIRLQTLKRAGAAIALFVAMSNLEKMRSSVQESIHRGESGQQYSEEVLMKGGLSGEALAPVRCAQLEIAYSELRLALKTAGFLDARLENKLRIERDENKHAISQNPNAILDLRSLQQCHDHLRAMVEHDTVCVFADYVPHDKDLYLSKEEFNPQQSLYDFLVRDYYNQADRSQASVLNQAALELDKVYLKKLEEELVEDYSNLIGDSNNKLSSETLDALMHKMGDVKKLETLEKIFKEIDANLDDIYQSKRTLRTKPKMGFTPVQQNHIECLQRKFLDILKSSDDPLVKDCIGPSALLGAKTALNAEQGQLKKQAREIVRAREQLRVAPKK